MRCNQPIRLNKNTQDEALVPCGYCWQCKDNRFKEWTFRLKEEWKNSQNAWFITLTYDEENIPVINSNGEFLMGAHNRGSPTIYMPHVSAFIKALRQNQDLTYTKYRKLGKDVQRWNIRFYAVAEYGSETNRPHYHLIVFNLYESIDIERTWKKGFITREPLTEGRIKYVSGYILDKDKYPKTSLKPTTRMSQGIGRSYVDRAKKFHLDNEELCSPTEGKKQRLPRYYQEKIFAQAQEKLEIARQKQKDYIEKQAPEPDHKVRLEQNLQNERKILARKRQNKL